MTAWTVVVPVKDLGSAKSRLDAPSGPARAELALAFARDTLTAVLGAACVASVVLVTSEPRMVDVVPPGVRVVPDPGRGLVAALAAGAEVVDDGPVALLLGDLPALRPAELDAALAAAADHERAMVPDAEGAGTTLLTAGRAGLLRPAFGPGSRDAHERAGHRILEAGPGLRRDVDTADDLAAAVRLGVGPATAAALAALAPLD